MPGATRLEQSECTQFYATRPSFLSVFEGWGSENSDRDFCSMVIELLGRVVWQNKLVRRWCCRISREAKPSSNGLFPLEKTEDQLIPGFSNSMTTEKKDHCGFSTT